MGPLGVVHRGAEEFSVSFPVIGCLPNANEHKTYKAFEKAPVVVSFHRSPFFEPKQPGHPNNDKKSLRSIRSTAVRVFRRLYKQGRGFQCESCQITPRYHSIKILCHCGKATIILLAERGNTNGGTPNGVWYSGVFWQPK